MTALGPLSLNILVPAVPDLVVDLEHRPGDGAAHHFALPARDRGVAARARPAVRPLRPPAGGACRACDHGRRRACCAIAMSSIGGLIAARTLQAFGASSGLVIGRAIVRDLYDRERAASMIGWVTTVMVVAPMVAPLIGGLLDTAFGWEAIFAFVAVSQLRGAGLGGARAAGNARPTTSPAAGCVSLRAKAASCCATAISSAICWPAAFATATFFAFLGGAPHRRDRHHGPLLGRIRHLVRAHRVRLHDRQPDRGASVAALRHRRA